MSYINTLWIYLLLAAIAAIVLIVGLYVYRDAKTRGMKAGVWTMIAVLMPCFIGLIIYVLLRDDEKNLRCTVCSYPAKPEWKVCPVCETPLPKNAPMISAPLKKDKGIWKVTAAAIVIPVLICVLMGAVMMPRMDNHYLGGMTNFNMTKDDVKSDELQKWFEACDKENGETRCYVLYQSRETAESRKEKETSYVIYIKGGDDLKYVDAETKFDQHRLMLETEEGKSKNGYVIMGTAWYDGTLDLVISIDGNDFLPENREAAFDLKRVIDKVMESD
ncbi:DUF420 domain-containing protein [Emergencia timonensis]|uniref:DUF420 domain-containing protein n=1 Tax=Emergencia timonensis TaxID=1776384 RepID=UPI001D07FFA8|nr:DUF420 domain-containing protein [Emergencia timonensis]MBS6177762.1 hypothetical protein [Clostridiales bacterium]MCB6477254.1 DUF420 domain-containing protein [Emergencia timonensis]